MENNTENTRTIEISVKEYEQLKARERSLEERVKFLEGIIRLSQKHRFGASSEKLSVDVLAAMDSLFDESEATLSVEESVFETETTEVAAHERRKKTYLLDDKLPEDVAVEVREHTLTEEERTCPQCGTIMADIGEEIRRELVLVPAQVKVIEHHIHTYACQSCKNTSDSVPMAKADKEPALIPGGFATPEAVAYIMTQKYVMGSPLYRQAAEWKRQGIELSRQTMSNWMLKCVELYLAPLYDRLHEKLLERDVLHADETTLQVLNEPDRAATSKSYMWLYRTGADAEHPIVLYNYQQGRGKEYPQGFLRGYKGYLQTDGYAVYHGLDDGITDVGCWAHLRRKFDEAKNALPKGKSAEMSAAMKALGYFTRIYKLEKQFAKLGFEERYRKRLEQEKGLVDEFFAWAEKLNVSPKSALGKALVYLENQKPYLLNYLKDGRLEIDNNRAERSIKPFVIDRKNFLFANTPRGAQGSATIFSLIETAKENKLDPYRYLVYVLNTAKQIDQSHDNWTDPLLPENAPDECKVNFKAK